MLNVIMLTVVMLSVVAHKEHHSWHFTPPGNLYLGLWARELMGGTRDRHLQTLESEVQPHLAKYVLIKALVSI